MLRILNRRDRVLCERKARYGLMEKKARSLFHPKTLSRWVGERKRDTACSIPLYLWLKKFYTTLTSLTMLPLTSAIMID